MARGRILVTGGTGFLGGALIGELRKRGRIVRASVRPGSTDLMPGVEIAHADIEREDGWDEALKDVDVLVHTAARAHVLRETSQDPLALFRRVNRDATLSLARQAAANGVRRFIFISSIGVNGRETMERPFRATDAPSPHSPYAVAKFEAELGLAEVGASTGLEVVIIRPPLVVGPNPKGNLAMLERLIAKGLPLPFGLVTRNRRDLASLDVLIDLIVTCIDHPAADGAIFLVSDGAPLSTRAILELLAARMGARLRLIPVPLFLLSMMLQAFGRKDMVAQLLGNLEVDIAPTRRRLDWKPPV